MRVASELGMAPASDDEPTRRGGRPTLPPIGLLAPEFVPMTASQHEIAIRTLAVLLDSWLKGERTVRTAGKLPVDRRSARKSLSDGRVSSLKSDA